MTDEDLLLEYRLSGDEELFTELFRRYKPGLLRFLYRRLHDGALAEEVLQTTFLRLFLRCGQFEEGRQVRPWLYTIAANEAIDVTRRNQRHKLPSLNVKADVTNDRDVERGDQLSARDDCPSLALEKLEERTKCRNVVDRLPQALKAVIDLVFFQGLKYREAAEVLAIPVGTVKSRVHKARSRLKDTWFGYTSCAQEGRGAESEAN
jgi:RNA polymerase sigma-70 factor (ECF subfamily)